MDKYSIYTVYIYIYIYIYICFCLYIYVYKVSSHLSSHLQPLIRGRVAGGAAQAKAAALIGKLILVQFTLHWRGEQGADDSFQSLHQYRGQSHRSEIIALLWACFLWKRDHIWRLPGGGDSVGVQCWNMGCHTGASSSLYVFFGYAMAKAAV